VAFHHRAAVSTGTGPLPLMRRSLTVQPGRLAHRQHRLGAARGVHGRDGLGEADGEQAALMEGLTQDRGIDAKRTGQGMEGWPLWPCEAFDGRLDVVESGQHIAGLTGIAPR
jgi:hypothetical protein